MAAGMSNAEIAAKLYLGEATVKTHVTHVLAKLNLRDRLRPSSTRTSRGWSVPADQPPVPVAGPTPQVSNDNNGSTEFRDVV
jgi:hypothetical protein